MLIILDRGDQPSIPQYGLGPASYMLDALTFAEYTTRMHQRFIEELGIPAAMFHGSMTYHGSMTGRATSNVPNMSQGSVRHLTGNSQ